MYWRETRQPEEVKTSARMVDMAFRIRCPTLPMDHAHALFTCIERRLPWFLEEPGTGIHGIRGAESAHGWQRPAEDEHGMIHLSQRVRLVLRIPRERIDQCATLSGKTLAVDQSEIRVGECRIREINASPTLFARCVVTAPGESEDRFVTRAHQALTGMDLAVPKLLPGRTTRIGTPRGPLLTRSLLLADVSPADSIRIQESGLGGERNLGCGLFIPYKSISAVE